MSSSQSRRGETYDSFERDGDKRKEDRHRHYHSSKSHHSSRHSDRYDTERNGHRHRSSREDGNSGSSGSRREREREERGMGHGHRSHRSRSPGSRRGERSRERHNRDDKRYYEDSRSTLINAINPENSSIPKDLQNVDLIQIAADDQNRPDESSGARLQRDDWMMSEIEDSSRTEKNAAISNGSNSNDYFSSLGTYSRERKPKSDKPNPDELKVSSRELNKQFIEGKHIDDYEDPRGKSNHTPVLGGPGSQWRMMKLRRVYEASEEEGREVEEVAMERYGSLDAFNEARTERQFLDDQKKGMDNKMGSQKRSGTSTPIHTSNPISRGSSRQSSFRKPGRDSESSMPDFGDAGREAMSSDLSKASTPIPNVFQPVFHDQKNKESLDFRNIDRTGISPPLSAAALNKLSAKVLRAEMMGSANAQELREEYERQKALSESNKSLKGSTLSPTATEGDTGRKRTELQVLPTLDARGRLYDVGKSQIDSNIPSNATKRQDSKKKDFNDEDEKTLADLVREERFGAGSATQKDMDAQMADRIMNDKSFKGTVDYMDDNIDRLSRKKMKSDAMKRMFAVQDYAKTKRVLDTCPFCWQDDRPPRVTLVSSGTKAFLALPETEPLIEDHCLIIPIQHHLSMLEADDDTWEEVKNFMKCIIQMEAKKGNGVIFYETIQSLKHQKHTCIEVVPVNQDLFSQLPGYFRQSIIEVSDEWAQNKGLIEFSQERPFRRCMVPDLPYFMVQWDHRGERGYGHTIEESENKMKGRIGGEDDYGDGVDDALRVGSGFPRWFAAEIIGTIMEYEPKRWRKPRRLQSEELHNHLVSFRKEWTQYDWTRMLKS